MVVIGNDDGNDRYVGLHSHVESTFLEGEEVQLMGMATRAFGEKPDADLNRVETCVRNKIMALYHPTVPHTFFLWISSAACFASLIALSRFLRSKKMALLSVTVS